MGQGSIWLKKMRKIQVLGMEFSTVENLSGPQRACLAYLEAPNLILMKNPKNCRILLNYPNYPYFPTLGQWLLGPWAAVIFTSCKPVLMFYLQSLTSIRLCHHYWLTLTCPKRWLSTCAVLQGCFGVAWTRWQIMGCRSLVK